MQTESCIGNIMILWMGPGVILREDPHLLSSSGPTCQFLSALASISVLPVLPLFFSVQIFWISVSFWKNKNKQQTNKKSKKQWSYLIST